MDVVIPAAEVTYIDDVLSCRIPVPFRAAVYAITDVGYLYMRIGKPRKPRTTGWKSQNHHINGHCQAIAVDTGCSFSAVKARMKELAVDRGYPQETLPDGSTLPASEVDIDTLQAAMLIDAIHQFADEYGIVLIEEDIFAREK